MNSPLVLIVDDDPHVGLSMSQELEQEGFRFCVAHDLRRARAALAREKAAAVLLDLRLPDGNGMELLAEIRERNPETALVILTGFGSVETAVEAMKAGADDFIVKSVPEQARVAVCNAIERRRLTKEVVRLRRALCRKPDRIVFRSQAMRELLDKAVSIAPYDVSVFIDGETGTGKELLARLIHDKSGRRNGPFIPIDCAALPESLFESEFFGYEKGAFTGADRRHKGRLERAQGGTVFLDEIGNLGVKTQVKILRVLQERSLERLGGEEPVALDIRVISATNVDLSQAMRRGLFRTDLYYRLNEVFLRLPPLRERPGELPILVEAFLGKYADAFGKPRPVLSEAARSSLEAYSWPGNIRELKSVVKLSVILADNGVILPKHLPPAVADFQTALPVMSSSDSPAQTPIQGQESWNHG